MFLWLINFASAGLGYRVRVVGLCLRMAAFGSWSTVQVLGVVDRRLRWSWNACQLTPVFPGRAGGGVGRDFQTCSLDSRGRRDMCEEREGTCSAANGSREKGCWADDSPADAATQTAGRRLLGLGGGHVAGCSVCPSPLSQRRLVVLERSRALCWQERRIARARCWWRRQSVGARGLDHLDRNTGPLHRPRPCC